MQFKVNMAVKELFNGFAGFSAQFLNSPAFMAQDDGFLRFPCNINDGPDP